MYRNLPKSVYSLAIVNFINGFGNFTFPFLTLFLTLKLGYSAAEAGAFSMLSMTMYVPGSLISSKLADKMSRKTIMVVTQTLFSLSFLACGILYSHIEWIPYILIIGLIFDGASDPARQALHTDHTNFKNRQEAFSLFYLSYNIGFGFGPAIAGLLFTSYPRWLFLGSGIIGLLATTIVGFTIHDKRPDHDMLKDSVKKNQTDKAVEGNVFKALLSRPKLFSYIIINGIFFFCVSIVLFSLPLFASYLFKDSGPTIYGFMMSSNAVTVVLITPFFVKLSKQKNTLTIIILSFILYLLGFNLLAIASTILIFVLSVITFSLGEALHATNNDYFIANHTPMGHRARFSTLISIIQGSGYAIGPLVGGQLLEIFSFKEVYAIVSIIIIICIFSLIYVRHTYIRDNEPILPKIEKTEEEQLELS
ncbi:MAG: MFS transporter [Sphaerochaetaceae bacterium]|nr:MFS transporter [Sphaerochaetaceae bacterium]